MCIQKQKKNNYFILSFFNFIFRLITHSTANTHTHPFTTRKTKTEKEKRNYSGKHLF